MEIVLVSGWMHFVSGQGLIYGVGLNRPRPFFFAAPLNDEKVITDPLGPGEWYGLLSQVLVLDKRTHEKRQFDVVVLPTFTISEDDVRAARKALSLDPLYALEIDLPADNADQPRGLSIGTGKQPFGKKLEIPSGARRVMIVVPMGTVSLALFGSAPQQKIADRTFVLSGPERWERMSLGD